MRCRRARLIVSMALFCAAWPSVSTAGRPAAAVEQTTTSQVDRGEGVRPGRAAGQRARGGARPALPSPEGRSVAEVEQLFDRYVLAQARQALRLDAAQMRAFAPRLQALQQTRRRAVRQRQALLRELNELTRPGVAGDQAALTAKLGALDQHMTSSEQQVRDAYQQLEQVLTLEQRARWPLFEQRMERQKLQLIARARAQVQGAAPSPSPEAAAPPDDPATIP